MEKILLLDNDNLIVDRISQWLTDEGYELIKMYSPKNLLAKIYESNPALIIIGISLHGADGRHFCSLLKTIEKTKHIKTIIMSPYFDDCEIEDYEWCADDFLYQPLNEESLLNSVKNTLNQQLSF